MPGQAFKKGERVHHAAAGGDGNVLASDLHGQRLGLQARAVAGLAGLRGLVLAKLLPPPGAVGLQHAAVERSEERRVGKECVSKCSSRLSPAHLTKKPTYLHSCNTYTI